jgi:hypothetical protein
MNLSKQNEYKEPFSVIIVKENIQKRTVFSLELRSSENSSLSPLCFDKFIIM